MNLVYFWIISTVSPENRVKIDRIIYAHEIEEESATVTGGQLTPPSWWLGDEDASMSNQMAMMQLRT